MAVTRPYGDWRDGTAHRLGRTIISRTDTQQTPAPAARGKDAAGAGQPTTPRTS